MRPFLAGLLVALLIFQAHAFCAEGGTGDMEYFLARDWGFECRRLDGHQEVRVIWARHVDAPAEKTFLSSLSALDGLNIESSRLSSDDIRSLVRSCPSLRSISSRNRERAASIDAAVWAEFFKFQELKDLSVRQLRCSSEEAWAMEKSRDLDTLVVSGNLSGMLRTLLAPCKVRSLQIELLASKQQLTVADYATLNSHTEIESLEILGDEFGGGMFVDLNALSGLTGLHRLTLRQCWVDPACLHGFPVLRALSLHTCRFVNHGFDEVLAHPKLEELVLWECNTKHLGIAGPLETPPKSIGTITLGFPVFEQIKEFHSLPCSYHVQVGHAGMCVPTAKAHTIRWLGRDETASLKQLKQLHSLSMRGGLPGDVKVSAAALLELARIDTLHSLEVRNVDVVEDASLESSEQDRDLEEVRFLTNTPLRREFVARFLGAHTRGVLMGDFSESAQAGSQSLVSDCSPKGVHLVDIDLPVSDSGVERQLLTSSTEHLILESCRVNPGAIQQLVASSPSLRRLTFHMCAVVDERELLHLNELPDLKWIEFAQTQVSAATALAMKAETVRFGRTWGTGTKPDWDR